MPCHPDRVRRNYEVTTAHPAAGNTRAYFTTAGRRCVRYFGHYRIETVYDANGAFLAERLIPYAEWKPH